MQAKFEMTDGWRNLKEILAGFPEGSSHWNEAQNRFQFVDRLLMECLGWSHPYIQVEQKRRCGRMGRLPFRRTGQGSIGGQTRGRDWQIDDAQRRGPLLPSRTGRPRPFGRSR